MTTPAQPDPAAELRAAAQLLRVPLALPFELALANWLEFAAREQDATNQAAQANWRGSTDTEARDRWIEKMTNHRALAVARALLGSSDD